MLLHILSPSKTLDFKTSTVFNQFTLPQFINESEILTNELRKLNVNELGKKMQISVNLARLTFERFLLWKQQFTLENSKQAIFAYKGDVYIGLNAKTLNEEELESSQNCLRILSGLYGILKPLDLIQAYRLEMGVNLENPVGNNLYEFWGDKITDELNNILSLRQKKILINLASNEYYKVIKVKKLKASIITPVFKEMKNGKYIFISIFAKKARGLMSRFIIRNNITEAEDLKAFDYDGYTFNPTLSKGNVWTFTR